MLDLYASEHKNKLRISKQMASQKCFECSKHVSIVDTISGKCRCGNIYCKHHKFEHQCAFDYKEHNKEHNKLVKLDDNKVTKI